MKHENNRAGRKDAGGAPTPPAGGTPAPNPDPNAEITVEQVSKMVTDAVAAAFKSANLPDAIKTAVDALDVKALIADAVKGLKPEGKAPAEIAAEAVAAAGSVVTKAIETALEAGRREHKAAGSGNPAPEGKGAALPQPGEQQRNQVEIPVGVTKGNLPVHMKQLLNVATQQPINAGIDAALLGKAVARGDAESLRSKMAGSVKAFTSTGTGTGDEWVDRDLSMELQRRLYLSSDVAQAFLSREIQMPTNPYDFPLLSANGDFYLNSVEGADAVGSDPTSAQFTLTAKTFRGMRQITDEATEDSLIPLLPTMEADLAISAARALEHALINGDTTATHMDSDTTSVLDARKAWKGWRKLALAVSALKADLSTGAISRANLSAVKKLLGKWGTRNREILWIVGSQAWADLQNLDEFALANQRGGATTFADGALPTAPWGGMIAVSEQCREDLNASGVYDGSTTTKGSLLCIHMPSFLLGSRRQWTVELERDVKAGLWNVVASFRKAFTPQETPSATVKTVAVGYNWTA